MLDGAALALGDLVDAPPPLNAALAAWCGAGTAPAGSHPPSRCMGGPAGPSHGPAERRLPWLLATTPDGRKQEKRDKMHEMHAQVRNGHLVIDEPTDLPEGTVVELKVVKMDDPWAGLDPEERAEIEEGIEAGFRDIENGDVVDARVFLAELRAITREG